jgi:DNA-directed RNA polymerase subunit L
MDVYIVEKTDNTITLGFKEENSVFIEPMIRALNSDKSVSLVRYINQHPELHDVVLYIEVKDGKPEDVVKRASKAVSAYFSAVKQ